MSFSESIKSVLSKYATFSGRARRSEFWYFFLAVAVINIVLNVLGSLPALGADVATTDSSFSINMSTPVLIVAIIVGLALIVPYIAVAVRRLHDQNKSGAMFWLVLIPFVGGLILLVMLIPEGTRGANAYGPDPKA